VKRLLYVSCLIGLCLACGRKEAPSASDRHYHLTGQVKSLDDKLQVGEHIEATINVHSDDSYDLSDIHASEAKK